MTAFPTCHTCRYPARTCEKLDALKASIAGLGFTSVRHRCSSYAPAYAPGDAIKVLTLPYYPQDDEPAPLKLWFPGHFIRLTGTRALVFVKKGAQSLSTDHCGNGYDFEPHGSGYLKVPLSRVAHRDADPVDVTACRWCAAILGVGDPCGRDPHYTPARDCLAAAREAQPNTGRRDRSEGTGPGRPSQTQSEGER